MKNRNLRGQRCINQNNCKQQSDQITVWKIHDISITQILREIKFGDSRSPKSAIYTHLEALNFDLYEFLHFGRLKFTKLTQFRASKNGKIAVL